MRTKKRMLKDVTAGKITSLLLSWDRGDRQALDRLLALVFKDLQRLARFHLLKQRPDHTFAPGALVSEMYLKLTNGRNLPSFKDRAHFFSFASRLMRLILIDYARARGSEKRRGAYEHVPLEAVEGSVGARQGFDVLALRRSLEALGARAPRHRRIVELRYFLGLGLEEVAEALGTSPSTVSREWAAAKAWLYAQLREPAAPRPKGDGATAPLAPSVLPAAPRSRDGPVRTCYDSL